MAEASGDWFGPINAEDGDTSQWSSLEEDTDNDFSADAAAANEGSYGYKVAFAGNNSDCYAKLTTDAGGTTEYFRFYIYFPSSSYIFSTEASAQTFDLFRTFDGNSGFYTTRMEAKAWDGGVELYRLFYQIDGPDFASITFNEDVSTGEWHYIEVKVATGAGTGSVEVWLDGVSIGSASSLDNNNQAIKDLWIGHWDSTGTPANGEYVYIDDVLGDSSAIGAYSEEAGGTTLTVMQHHYAMMRK